ncbi:SDR family NAD(P)-dependent oxidoreductase, partial [Moorena sp. SIO3H5]|uniref:SDR family NAD(P)-dependent oxidoreductase n=1 Tax=Moorena sp. SIO3H5 TaxID=2607834 RepID=UPI0013B7279D
NTGRAQFHHRLAVIASNQKELLAKLQQHQRGAEPTGVYHKQPSQLTTKPKTAFLFTGQGSQYVKMGQQLYQQASVFREAIDKCDRLLRGELEHPITKILYDSSIPSELLDQTEYTQPVIFAVEYALAQLWQSWGIKPDIVMGHSLGEYVAATIAGIFSVEEGLKLITRRGKLMQQLPSTGEMVSVRATESSIREKIREYREEVAIAAINGEESVVISGATKAITEIVTNLESEGIKTKRLQVSHPFHSPLMEPMLAEFEQVANQVNYNQPRIGIISNVTGEKAEASIGTAKYWVNHITQPVRFSESIETLVEEGVEVFLEIGAQPILLGMGRSCVSTEEGVWLPSLRQGVDEWESMLCSLGKLYVEGGEVDWSGMERDYQRQKVVLPTYPFQRQRYWIDTATNPDQDGSVSENISSSIVNLLHQGQTEILAQKLETVGNFSSEQLQLLPELLKVLAKEHHQEYQQQLSINSIKNWFYQIQWQPLPDETQPQTMTSGSHWLILADSQTGVAEKLARKLQQQGNECSLVVQGEKYEKRQPGIYEINPCVPLEFEQLVQDILESSKLPWQKIIHLWSLDVPRTEDLTIGVLEEAQMCGCGSVVYLLQAVLKTSSVPQLWLVTRGTQPVLWETEETEEIAVASSPLWGLGRVVSLEHPKLWGGLIDLDPQAKGDETEILLELTAEKSVEDHLAVRREKTYVARLVKEEPKASPAMSLDSDGTYLITGGLGALGLQTAQWMVSKGARHLVLIGRSTPSEIAQESVEQLRETGTKVSVLLKDISIEKNVVHIFDHIHKFCPILKGIVHTAGLIDDGILQQMTWEKFTRVMRPKVAGSWHLHKLTQNISLDFFVYFSSMASLLGSPGQGNYAAANAFMDSLAYHRRRISPTTLSINWGAWEQAGMAASLASQHQARIENIGMGYIPKKLGMQALEQLLQNPSTGQIGIAPINWSVFAKQLTLNNCGSLLLELLQQEELQQQLSLKKKTEKEFIKKLKAAPLVECEEILRDYLQSQVAKVLGLSSSQLLETNLGFMEMGMDSLMAVELNNQLQDQLEITLPPTVVFEYPTIEKLSNYISLEVMNSKSFDSSNSDMTTATQNQQLQADRTNLQVLSDEEIEAKLISTLSNMGY